MADVTISNLPVIPGSLHANSLAVFSSNNTTYRIPFSSLWVDIHNSQFGFITVEYLVIAGGGGGAGHGQAGGGGAGGYRSSVIGQPSGGGNGAEPVFKATPGTPYNVVVGAGGAGGINIAKGSNGSDSVFANIISTGGGGGGAYQTSANSGGSGGGAPSDSISTSRFGGKGISGQGFRGGSTNAWYTNWYLAGGGGGAGEPGAFGGGNLGPQEGGCGVSSNITGEVVFRAGGGGGGSWNWGYGGAGGHGGGGSAGQINQPTGQSGFDGAINTGGGGGGANGWAAGLNGGNGGSGVIILRYNSNVNLQIGLGLTAGTVVIGDKRITTFTGGAGSIIFSL